MCEEIEIKHCSICSPIDRDEIKYRTEIIATSCLWRENLEVDYTLQLRPKEKETYFVVLYQPVKFKVGMELWLLYNCPTAYYNGYENETEIEQTVFCFGQITELVTQDDLGATIKFSVNKVVTLNDLVTRRLDTIQSGIELPNWTDFYHWIYSFCILRSNKNCQRDSRRSWQS